MRPCPGAFPRRTKPKATRTGAGKRTVAIFNNHWRKLLTGGLPALHGAYIGEKRVVLDRSNLTATDFASLAKVTKVWLNTADAVRDERIPKEVRSRQDYRVTGQALPRDKRINAILENLQILCFDNTGLTIDDLADYELPPFSKVHTLQVCNSPAAKKMAKMSSKKHEALMDKMRTALQNLKTIAFCKN